VADEGSPRTYEVPPGGADAVGLEDYVVEAGARARIGTVVSSVEESGRRWLIVESGMPPFKRDRRAIPWSEIEEVDHDSLVVRVAAQAAQSLARLEDAGRESEAPAKRVTEASDAPSFVPTGDVAGPTDRTTLLFGALATFALGLLTLLAIVGVLSRHGMDTLVLVALVVPAALLVASALLGYRLWRDPYSR
jgi:hypothetical protein